MWKLVAKDIKSLTAFQGLVLHGKLLLSLLCLMKPLKTQFLQGLIHSVLGIWNTNTSRFCSWKHIAHLMLHLKLSSLLKLHIKCYVYALLMRDESLSKDFNIKMGISCPRECMELLLPFSIVSEMFRVRILWSGCYLGRNQWAFLSLLYNSDKDWALLSANFNCFS